MYGAPVDTLPAGHLVSRHNFWGKTAVEKQDTWKRTLLGFALGMLALSLPACTGGQSGVSVQQPTQPPAVATRVEYVSLTESVPSEARAWSAAEVTSQITDMTYLRNRPGVGNEVYYFSPDHVVYSWATGGKYVQTATWSVSSRTPLGTTKASLYICMPFTDIDSGGNAIAGRVTTRCFDPAILYVVSVDRARGDVFGLRGRKQAPLSLPIPRTTIATLKQTS